MNTKYVLGFMIMAFAGGLVNCSADTSDDSMTEDEALKPRGGLGDDGSGDPPPFSWCYVDADHDGHGNPSRRVRIQALACSGGYAKTGDDCDDTNPNIQLGTACYRDADGDGAGSTTIAAYSCSGACPAGSVANSDDCDDTTNSVAALWCFADVDKDGYAGTQVKYTQHCPASCAAVGLATDNRDCNDGNASVHPEQDETTGNGVDDNCNGLTDEATFEYDSNASLVTTTSIRLAATIREPQAAAYARSTHQLWAWVDVSPLTSSRTHTVVGPLFVAIDAPPGGEVTGEILVDGLAPATPYRAFIVKFAKDAAGTQLLPTIGTLNEPGLADQPSPPSMGDTSSNVYYTTTLSDSADSIASIRPLIVLRSLHDWNESMIGHVKNGNAYCHGYDCDVDHGGHKWCSEFYNTMVSPWIVDLDPYPYGIDYDVTNVRGKFVSYGSYNTYTGTSMLSGFAQPGDFVAMIDDKGNVHHTAMFIAWDASVSRPWTLSGNVGNRIGFGPMPEVNAATIIGGIGHLIPSMRK